MLHIVMIIIKFLGILFLSLLGILLFLLCAMLFIPIRYEGKGSYLEKPEGRLRFTWLFHFVCVQLSYQEEKTAFSVRVFGKTLRKKKKEAISEKKDKEAKKRKRGDTVKNEEEPSTKSTEQQKSITEIPSADEKTISENTEKETVLPDTSKLTKKSQKDTGKSFTDNKKFKILRFQPIQKIKEGFEKAKEGIQKIKTIKTTIKEKKEKIISFFQNVENKATLLLLKNEIWLLVGHLRPRKLIINLHFGMEDPSQTGIILGILCILYPFYKNNINIKPDFENKILEGDFYCKGRVHCFRFLHTFLHLWKDKNFRKIIKNFIK